jgi:hypothetical protein
MHNEELKSAYLSLHISRMIKGKGGEMGNARSTNGDDKYTQKFSRKA